MAFHPDELRGFHGRWSTSSSGRKKVDRSDLREIVGSRRDRAAAGARSRKEGRAGAARKVNAAFNQREAGKPLTLEQTQMTERAAVKGTGSFWARLAQANADRANGIVHLKTRREAHASERKVHQADHGGLHVGRGGARTGIKQSFTGKAVVVRGTSPVAFKSPKKTARSLMSTKPAAPKAPAHQQYTRKDLVLKSDAWMREQLAARGIAIPKGARTKVLQNLLVGD